MPKTEILKQQITSNETIGYVTNVVLSELSVQNHPQHKGCGANPPMPENWIEIKSVLQSGAIHQKDGQKEHDEE